jgi:hypothetical protein
MMTCQELWRVKDVFATEYQSSTVRFESIMRGRHVISQVARASDDKAERQLAGDWRGRDQVQ